MPSQELAAAAPAAGLTPEQKQQVVAAAAALLPRRRRRPARRPAGRLPEHIVAGTFVSLKRGRHLRSCCGMLGTPTPLAQAWTQAAYRTAWEDVRFPPVSPAELEHLDMEVWLLYNPQPVPARGEERLTAVTVGRHGIQVVRGEARGLFLPSVAVDRTGTRAASSTRSASRRDCRPPPGATTPPPCSPSRARRCSAGPTAPRAGRPTAGRPCRAGGPGRLRRLLPQQPRGPAHRGHAELLPLGRPDGTVSGVVLTLQRADTGTTTALQPDCRCGPACRCKPRSSAWCSRPPSTGEPADHRRRLQRPAARRHASCTIRSCTAPSPTRTWPGSTRAARPAGPGTQQVGPGLRSRSARPRNCWPRRPRQAQRDAPRRRRRSSASPPSPTSPRSRLDGPEAGARPGRAPAGRRRHLLRGRCRGNWRARWTACWPASAAPRSLAGRHGAARRAEVLRPHRRRRAAPHPNSQARSSSSGPSTRRWAWNGRWRRTRPGRCPAAASSPTSCWPASCARPSPAWRWTRPPTSASTPSRWNCRCWPGWRRRAAGGRHRHRPRRPGELPPLRRGAGRRAARARGDAAAAHLQRHEPLRHRRREPPPRRPGPGRPGAARPGGAVRDGDASTASACAACCRR